MFHQAKLGFLKEIRTGLSTKDVNVLKQWQLKHVQVREFAYGKGDVLVRDVMQAIADAVPGINSWDI